MTSFSEIAQSCNWSMPETRNKAHGLRGVYFVENVDRRLIKIGFTDVSVLNRINHIRSKNHDGSQFALIAVAKSNYSRKLEETMHEYFAKARYWREWFEAEPVRIALYEHDLIPAVWYPGALV